MGRVVVLGHGLQIGLRDYVDTLRRVFTAPPSRLYPYSLRGWSPADGATIHREFLAAVHDRINRHLPTRGGRNQDPDVQATMRSDARRINQAAGERHIVRATEITTRGWRKRFAHVLTTQEDL